MIVICFIRIRINVLVYITVPSPSGKALGFDLSMRRFESYRPSHFYNSMMLLLIDDNRL